MKKIIVFFLFQVLFFFSSTSWAAVLTFDDLPDIVYSGVAPLDPIGSYGGLAWSNMAYGDPVELNFHIDNIGSSGYSNGLVSTNHVASGNSNSGITGPTFNFEGAYLTGAWRDGLNINIQGYNGGSLLYDTTVVVDSTSATWFDFNYLSIDTLVFDSYGGTAHGYSASGLILDGDHFVMDNFTYAYFHVPEPISFSLLCFGLVGLGFRRRYSQRLK
jgi:hypothetical protein